MAVLVTTAAEAAARDAAAIRGLRARGASSFVLMQAAGDGAARHIHQLVRQRGSAAVAVYAGAGNNGGDAWIVAQRLREQGVEVAVRAAGDPRTDDAGRARDEALAAGDFPPPVGTEAVVVDGLLGTGASGPPRAEIAACIGELRQARARGAHVIALDVPSGLDATTGDDLGAVAAHDTCTFGTLKRGLLIRRDLAGAVAVFDIGVGDAGLSGDTALPLLDPVAARAAVPRIDAAAHKGTRGRVVIVGGAPGMAGAAILAARAALRSGAGLVYCAVAPESRAAVQSAVPYALAPLWDDAMPSADAVAIGPGLGAAARALTVRWLADARAEARFVLDADALNAFAGDVSALHAALHGRAAILTPHPGECARLLGVSVADVLRDRFTIGRELARASGAVVVLKGTPTVISAPDRRVVVAPVGSPALATGGSGDLLSGVLGALFAVMPDPVSAACAAVWAHGSAAERAATSLVRGVTLSDVESELGHVWHAPDVLLAPGTLAALPAVGE